MWENLTNTALTMLVGLIVTAIFNGAINIPKKKRAEDAQREEDIRLLKKGIQALLKNDLKVRYDYWLDQEYAPEDAREDLEGMQTMRTLGKNMAFLIRAIKAEKEKNGLPELEKKIYTNFIKK
jgi:hypothetical protein